MKEYPEGLRFEKFTWKIHNLLPKLDSKKKHKVFQQHSETFFLCGLSCRITIDPKGDNTLNICVAFNDDIGRGKFAFAKLALINQANNKMTKTYEIKFEATNYFSWMIIHNFTSSSELIVNGISIIEVEIAFCNPEHHETQLKSNFFLPDEISHSDLVDFKGLGKIEKAFVPLLEEVCSKHPSLVEFHKKRSRTHIFTQWAFTALGRVLHFLKTKKGKDMDNDDACNQLQILWEELETCGFDLEWLRPHLQSALDMKRYNERVMRVKKLRKNVDALETKLQIATTELVKAEQGLEEKDLDAELGYGGP